MTVTVRLECCFELNANQQVDKAHNGSADMLMFLLVEYYFCYNIIEKHGRIHLLRTMNVIVLWNSHPIVLGDISLTPTWWNSGVYLAKLHE